MKTAIVNRRIGGVSKVEWIAEHVRTCGQTVCQDPVIVQKPIRKTLKTDLNLVILLQVLLQVKRRSPVWFSKKYIQPDAEGLAVLNFFQKPGHPITRPGPLAEFPQAAVIYRNND